MSSHRVINLLSCNAVRAAWFCMMLLDCVLILALHRPRTISIKLLKDWEMGGFWQLISNVQWNQLFSMLRGPQCAIFGCVCNTHCFAIGFSLCGVLLNNFNVFTSRRTARPSVYGFKPRRCSFMCLQFVLWTCWKISITPSALALFHSF